MAWKEKCSCGASIKLEYEPEKQETRVKEWRRDHVCPKPVIPQPAVQREHEHRDNSSTVETRWSPDIGFQPNQEMRSS